MVMAPGMIFTIEPMVNMGKADIYIDDKNGWEVYTDDGLPSAQWGDHGSCDRRWLRGFKLVILLPYHTYTGMMRQFLAVRVFIM